jgi:hemoglobin
MANGLPQRTPPPHPGPRDAVVAGHAGWVAASTMYDRVGGEAFFETLTRRFYAGVAGDPVLVPLYPSDPDAFEQARVHLQAFLVQFWGGPGTYSEQRGHPRLRMRHAPFVVGEKERDAWLRHMVAAVRAAGLKGLDEAQMLTYFESAATHMINVEPPTS